jgi:hypothetical protein
MSSQENQLQELLISFHSNHQNLERTEVSVDPVFITAQLNLINSVIRDFERDILLLRMVVHTVENNTKNYTSILGGQLFPAAFEKTPINSWVIHTAKRFRDQIRSDIHHMNLLTRQARLASTGYSKLARKLKIDLLEKENPPSDIASSFSTLGMLSVTLSQNFPMQVEHLGIGSFFGQTLKSLSINWQEYAQLGEAPYKKSNWRRDTKSIGTKLYHELFDHPTVSTAYQRAHGMMPAEHELSLAFVGAREMLRLPLEFLHDGNEYLVLKHPLIRRIQGVYTRHRPISSSFLSGLAKQKKPLKILLIASNTQPYVPLVDLEVEFLRDELPSLAQRMGVELEITCLPTEKSTYNTVKKQLTRCEAHILHYAGHGLASIQRPEESSLYFWAKRNKGGPVLPMKISELSLLLRDSALRFVYLSCCLAATTAVHKRLVDNDFLGIADGIIQSGVPALFGYRWPVNEGGALGMATTFYSALFSTGHIESAALAARQQQAQSDRNNNAWITPVVIVQG